MLHYNVWNIDTIQIRNVFVGEMHQATVFALPACLPDLLEGAMNCVPVR